MTTNNVAQSQQNSANIRKNLQILESQGAKFCKPTWGTKRPEYKDWPNKPCSLKDIDLERENVGLIFGHGNFCALDVDNQAGANRFTKFFGKSPQEFNSVSWTSGKQFDGFYSSETSSQTNIQVLFKLTPEQAAMLPGNKQFENNTLDIRCGNTQSCLPCFSPHETTGKPYRWHHAPSEYAIAPMPDDVWKQMLSELGVLSKGEQSVTQSSLNFDEEVPLIQCLAKHHRELVISGMQEGGRNDAGAALVRDLIGTSERLDFLGIKYSDRPEDLFNQYCDACTPPLDEDERGKIWNSGKKDNPTPCLSDDKLENCAKAWQRQQRSPKVCTAKNSNHPATKTEPKNVPHQNNDAYRNTPKADTEWADEIAETYRNQLAWDETASQWYAYSAEHNGLWSSIADIEILKKIKAEVQSQGRECGHSRIVAIEKVLRINLYELDWNQAPNLVPFRDGVFDKKDKQLKAHAPEHKLTWQLPRNYHSESDSCEGIMSWLDFAVQGSVKDKEILIAFLGNLAQNTGECQNFLHLQGVGGTGKSTYIRLAEDVIGVENHYSSSLNEWNNTRFESAGGYGMRLITFPDENNKIKNIESFKKLTGGDPVRYEEKGRKASNYKYTGSVIVASNHSPFVGGSASAIARREIPVYFNARVVSKDRRDLNKEFQPELPAFTRYLLSLPEDWIHEKLQGHETFGVITSESWANRCSGDSIAAWLDDWVVAGDFSTPIGNKKANSDDSQNACETLYQSYTLYCEYNNYRPKSTRNFSSDLMELGTTVLGLPLKKAHTRIGNVIEGLRLRKSFETDTLTITESLEVEPPVPEANLSCEESVVSPMSETNSPCEGSVKDSVKDSVKAGTLAMTDCEGCEGKTDTTLESYTDAVISEMIDDLCSCDDKETLMTLSKTYGFDNPQLKRRVWEKMTPEQKHKARAIAKTNPNNVEIGKNYMSPTDKLVTLLEVTTEMDDYGYPVYIGLCKCCDNKTLEKFELKTLKSLSIVGRSWQQKCLLT